jgi:uncharacterized protein YecE (DUF72 family)
VRIRVGTSGYSYKEWKGSFYPEDLPAAKMLEFYATRFDTVEINNTFYRMPEAKMLDKWATQVPDSFTFVLKAPQRITHRQKLSGSDEDVRYLFEVASTLGPKLGPVLFQLPPFFRKDADKLRAFLGALPPKCPVAFEFRHESWCDDEVYSILRERDVPICLSDTDEVTNPDALVIPTASWGYLRLRRTEYSDDAIRDWTVRVAKQPWREAYIFFKHEDEARGPLFAERFRAAWYASNP